MKKETVKWIVKAMLAGLAAFALLCAACAFYFNVPVRVSNPDETTEYRYEPNRRYFRGTEGFGSGRTNNEGFNNLRDYKHGDTINILLMGSSHMEGFCVPQADSAAAVLNRLFGGEKYVYNIGMAAHTFPYCAEHLDRALAVYAPTDAVVIELAKLGYGPAELDAAADGTLPEIRAHEGGIVTAAQKIPYLRLFYTKYFQGGGQAAEAGASETTPAGDFEASLSRLLQKLGETGRAHGVDVILAYTPTVLPDEDGHIAVQEQPDERALYQKLCAENGLVFLDLTGRNIAAAEELGRLPFGFANTSPGTGHINRLGLRLFAEGVYEQLSAGRAEK